jgi:hypothetical protein
MRGYQNSDGPRQSPPLRLGEPPIRTGSSSSLLCRPVSGLGRYLNKLKTSITVAGAAVDWAVSTLTSDTESPQFPFNLTNEYKAVSGSGTSSRLGEFR